MRPVVGQGGDDGVARPAQSAGGEGITISAVGGVVYLLAAVVTQGEVGCQGQIGTVGSLAGNDLEVGKCLLIYLLHAMRGDYRQAGGTLQDCPVKSICLLSRSVEADMHAIGGVVYPAMQAVLLRQLIDKRPEAHPLNDTLQVNVIGSHD